MCVLVVRKFDDGIDFVAKGQLWEMIITLRENEVL
jgi:hypothetical protein